MSETKILNPVSGNRVNIRWALQQGVVDTDGNYLKDDKPVSFKDVVDTNDVELTDEEMLAVEDETRSLVVAFVAQQNEANLPETTKPLLVDSGQTSGPVLTGTDAERDDLLSDSNVKEAEMLLGELAAMGVDINVLKQMMLGEGFNMGALQNILADMKANPQATTGLPPSLGANLALPLPTPIENHRLEEYVYKPDGSIVYEYATVFTPSGGMKQIKQPKTRRTG